MNEKLIGLSNACVEVHKTSADEREARNNFRHIVQAAYDLGAGVSHDPEVGARGQVNPPQKTVQKACEEARAGLKKFEATTIRRPAETRTAPAPAKQHAAQRTTGKDKPQQTETTTEAPPTQPPQIEQPITGQGPQDGKFE